MNCMPSVYEANIDGESLREKGLPAGLARKVRDRQAAVLHLQAATMTDDAVRRKLLRRRAAELILPRLGDLGRPRAC
jgi:hypothetical protein